MRKNIKKRYFGTGELGAFLSVRSLNESTHFRINVYEETKISGDGCKFARSSVYSLVAAPVITFFLSEKFIF